MLSKPRAWATPLCGCGPARSQGAIDVVIRQDPARTNIRNPPTTHVFNQQIYSEYTDVDGVPTRTIELEPEVPAAAIAAVMEYGPPVLKDLARRE
jgi:hypothetical protein